jgi:hypothetical protein
MKCTQKNAYKEFEQKYISTVVCNSYGIYSMKKQAGHKGHIKV